MIPLGINCVLKSRFRIYLTELLLKLKFLEIHIFIKLGVTSWYQSSSLSEPLAIGVGLGLKQLVFCAC